jgi:UDP-N-acetylmuramoyl-tripeptide--D-alanyl-D-alanine ligase
MLTLKQLAMKIAATYQGEDLALTGVSIDSRTIKPHQLFIALRAQRDGHDFIADAVKKGACAVMVDHAVDINIPQIIVKDTLLGLGALAQAWRQQFSIPIIAITGTTGKTTTKEMIASILSECGSTLATEVNFNNAIGVPLTLLKLNESHRYAVIEMGTNSPGEIAYAAHITQPTVALITNIHAQHVEKLGSIAGVSKEKSDIFTALIDTGIAIINLDEPLASSWQEKIPTEHKVTFGLNPQAEIKAAHIHYDFQRSEFDLLTPLGIQAIAIPIGGRHIVSNALAAAAATMAVGAGLTEIAQGLAKLKYVQGRFQLYYLPTGAMLIDDAYNASFKSVENALDALNTFNGAKVFVMSNMTEMGAEAEYYHEKMGEIMANMSLDAIFLYGDQKLLDHTLKRCPKAQYFKEKQKIIAALLPLVTQKDTLILVKGSRSNHMHDIVAQIRAHFQA